MYFFRQKSSNSRMLSVDKVVLFGCSVSCSSLPLITSNAAATGMEVRGAVTSNEVIHSPSSNLVFLISLANSLLLVTW